MPTFLLVERLVGDYAGHLAIIQQSSSLKVLQERRKSIIQARVNKPLFQPAPNQEDLEARLKVVRILED